MLGAATIWSNKAADVATAHVLVGALSLGMGAMLSLIGLREAAASREPARQTVNAEALPFPPLEPRTATLTGLH